MRLKEQLESLIEEHGINTSKLAKLTGIPNSTISDWLGGSNPKNITQVKKVANYFNISVDYLCFGEPQRAENINEYKDEINAGVFEVVLRRVKYRS